MGNVYLSPNTLNMKYVQSSQKTMDLLTKQFCSDDQAKGYQDIININLFFRQENSITSMENYMKNNQISLARLDTMNHATSSAINIATHLREQLILQRNTESLSTLNLNEMAVDKLTQLTSYLNGTFNGEYVLSGSMGNAPSVTHLGQLGALSPNSGPDYSYFLGNTDPYQVQANDAERVTCSSTAKDNGFELLIRSLRVTMGAAQNAQNFDQCMASAIDLCGQAIDGMIDSQTNISQARHQINAIYNKLEGQKVEAQEVVKKIGYPDISQVAMDFFQQKTALSLSREILAQNLQSIQRLVEIM